MPGRPLTEESAVGRAHTSSSKETMSQILHWRIRQDLRNHLYYLDLVGGADYLTLPVAQIDLAGAEQQMRLLRAASGVGER